MRIAVTGAAGMLGHTLVRVAAREGIPAVGVVRHAAQAALLRGWGVGTRLCDVADGTNLAPLLADRFDVLINCAGVTKAVCDDPVEASRVNALAPHLLARACTRSGVRLIHLSTDCVFSGRRGNYSEDDTPDPVDLYGRSKLLGEVTYGGHLTVRTSFVGRELATRHGLLEWFLSRTGVVDGYARAFWSGLSTIALSRILLDLAGRPAVGGVLNVTGERVSKFDVLNVAREAFKRDDVVVRRVDEPLVDRSLAAGRLTSLGIVPPTVHAMVEELASSDLESP